MDGELERRVAERAVQLAEAIRAADAEAVKRLCVAETWERSASDEFAPLLGAGTVEVLGALGHRSLLRLDVGHGGGSQCIEQLWQPHGDDLLIEDQRLFTLADRAAIEASGDHDRLERLRTKLDSQDAAERYAAALREHDEAAAAACFEPGIAVSAELDLHARLPALVGAELIGGVGPRTLLQIQLTDEELTVEYLWRSREGVPLIAGARAFRPVE